MVLKRGDPIADDVAPAAKELAQFFIRNWCVKALEKAKAEQEAQRATETVEAFALQWFQEVVIPNNSNPRNVKRALDKDVIPAIGSKQIADVTVTDILAITDKIKNRGSDQMALQTRNVLKRLFAYAIAREKTQFNPAAAIEAKFIATAKSRDVALTPDEIGKLLRAIYQSSMKRAHNIRRFACGRLVCLFPSLFHALCVDAAPSVSGEAISIKTKSWPRLNHSSMEKRPINEKR